MSSGLLLHSFVSLGTPVTVLDLGESGVAARSTVCMCVCVCMCGVGVGKFLCGVFVCYVSFHILHTHTHIFQHKLHILGSGGDAEASV